ncbi:BPI-like_protein [Hexamita inflata]|uniref:BPI-like protein n=1 Tax=Hexamita inflata TaxID=28002 RepID=A0AA86R671_9EUKA|nr:BPI-like protein [Hexamita inflata]
MILNFIRAEVDYESLQIILDGGDSWLFQSIINLVLSEIEDVVVGSLCNILLKAFIGLINDVFEDGHRLNEYPEHNQVLKDERYTSGIYTSSEGFVTLRFSGYVYHRNSLQDEFMTSSKLSSFTYNKFNSDMQVVIHEAAVNNAFYIQWWALEMLF